MASRHSQLAIASLAMTVTSTAALAHTGIGGTSGFLHGFSHPVGGVDHILAMLMVGILAWRLGGRALWLLPAAFVLVMAFGGVLGMTGVHVPLVEVGIALSVVVLGAAVAFDVKAPVAVAAALVGVFALFHGHAHGAGMPAGAGGLAYAAGFMVATALLHAVGIRIGFLTGSAGEKYGALLVRAAGGLAACVGVGLMAGGI